MEVLKIDPEFKNKIPPLSEDEYKQLEENILSDGEVYEPIIVWNGTIVDGHNRWKIICDHWDILGKKYRTKDMNFPDKWAAFEWMYKKQLGRRNLTEEQRTVLLGRIYTARKKTQGTNNQYIQRKSENLQSEDFHDSGRTINKIAQELGVGASTVERAEKFSKGIDALAEVSKEAADEVMKGKTGVSKKTIRDLPNMEPKKQKEIANAILDGSIKTVQKKESKTVSTNPRGWPKEDRENRKQTEAFANEMFDTSRVRERTVDDFIVEIRWNGEAYVDLLARSIDMNGYLLNDENRDRVVQEIESLIKKIEEQKGKLL